MALGIELGRFQHCPLPMFLSVHRIHCVCAKRLAGWLFGKTTGHLAEGGIVPGLRGGQHAVEVRRQVRNWRQRPIR